MKAGVFDSGLGGLTVVKSLLNAKLFDEILYYGDTARVPYGSKDKNTIIRYSLEALEYFENYDIDILIIACNTASAYALDELKKVSKIPVVGVIDSGILAVSNNTSLKETSILVLGTKATISSNLYSDGLKELGFNNIQSIATPLFVPLVEEEIYSGDILDQVMKHYFANINDIDIVVLGCTHFPLIASEISKYFRSAKTIHSGDAIVDDLITNYNCTRQSNKSKISFFASSDPKTLKAMANKWLMIEDE